jgi:hypothetical protein
MTSTTATHTAEQTHDEEFYRLLSEISAANRAVTAAAERMCFAAATYTNYFGGFRRVSTTSSEGEKATPEDGALVKGSKKGYPIVSVATITPNGAVVLNPAQARHAIAAGADTTKYDAAVAVVDAFRVELAAHEENYTGWTRFMLVTSSTGHVHSSMNCSTCRWTTEFAPVVALSGSTADEAIAALGETLCSVCFPDAPIAGKVGKITAAAARKILAA